MANTAAVVICGAGMAGVAAAYHLAVRRGVRGVALIDERPPLTLTSNKGTEAYRNWWPGPGDDMVRLMNRSIDLLEELAEETGNGFQLNRRGYVFLTARPDQAERFRQSAEAISARGGGPLRRHPGPAPYTPSPAQGFAGVPDGADLVLDPAEIRRHFPFVTDDAAAMLHVRRAGWYDTQWLGRWMLAQAEAAGVRRRLDRVKGVGLRNGRVESVRLRSGENIHTETLVIAAGPYLKAAGAWLGLDLPVVNELHGKIAFPDDRGVIPPEAPLMIWDDPLYLPWTDAERQAWAARPETARLLEEFPAGVHFRTRTAEGRSLLLVIWTYDARVQEPVWPPSFDPHYPEVLLRGLARMVPGLSVYFGQGHRAVVDGGYYCKTPENRPLIGALPVGGAYVLGALSGFGIMAAQAAAELLADHVTGGPLPVYAPAFDPARYRDPAYTARRRSWDTRGGQL